MASFDRKPVALSVAGRPARRPPLRGVATEALHDRWDRHPDAAAPEGVDLDPMPAPDRPAAADAGLLADASTGSLGQVTATRASTLRPRTIGAVQLWDGDAARAAATAQTLRALLPPLGLATKVQLHVDAAAERELGAGSSHGAACGDTVFIRPRGFDPRSVAGRRLLAHELVHVAQARLPGATDASPRVAESEAATLAEAFARGATLHRPGAALRAPVAHDDGERAREDELLKVPKSYHLDVSLAGMYFKPVPAQQHWIGNVDREMQALAVLARALVGKRYTVALLRELKTYLDANGGISSDIEGPATQDEVCAPILVGTELANAALDFFLVVRKPVIPLALDPTQIVKLRKLADLKQIWARLQQRGWIKFRWYTQTIFSAVMMKNAKLLAEFQAAGDDDDKLLAAELKREAQLLPYERAINAIRRDPVLTDEPGYRGLSNLPAKAAGETRKPLPVDRDSEVDETLAIEFLFDLQAHHPPQDMWRAADDAAFRKQLLLAWAARMKLAKIDTGGDIALRDAPGKAVQPADPATMFSHPALEPPYYDRQAGSEMLFWMTVYSANMWEHFRTWHYAWEVIRVPHDDWSKRDEVGTDPNAQGEDYGGFGRILGSRFRRNLSNAAVDVKRSLSKVEVALGPAGTSRVGLTLGGSALSALGSVIKTAFGKISERASEYNPAIRDPGVYIVRCTATRRDDESWLIRKLPSSAYLPIWVREPDEIAADRVNVDNAMAQIENEQLNAIQEKLKDQSLPKADRAALEGKAQELIRSLFGDAATQLRTERAKLDKVRTDPTEWAKLDKAEQKALAKRIDDIDFIVGKRATWINDDIGGDALGAPEKLVAYFITQEGPSANRPMRLLLETVPVKASKGMFRFAVLDDTERGSEHALGPERAERADAIADAVRELLEDVGYGRGRVTIAIPKSLWDVGAKSGEVRSIEIARSDKQLLFEGLENLALVGSIAAIVAAPFTEGASLALLIPLGVVGAVPSAYRIAHRVSEGTFEWDMATAMDLLNCIGAVAGLGQAATSLKLISASARVWMIVGLGMDGLQVVIGTYDLVSKISGIDPSLPPGARMAEAMVIVGNALLQLGIAIGGRMVAEGQMRRERIESKLSVEANPNITRAPAELARPLIEAGIDDVPVLHDKSIDGPEARIEFTKDGYGLPTDMHIVASLTATPEMIRLHVESVQLLQKYSGFSGWIRTLVDRFNALVASKQFVKPGSRGWNALVEVRKINRIIEHYSEEIAKGHVSKIDGEAYLDYLKGEVRRHQQSLNEVEEGAGFIAVQAPRSAAAQAHGYPPAEPGHYYIEESPGHYQLRAHVGFEGKAKMVVAKRSGAGYDIVERPPEAGVAEPGTPGAKTAAKVPPVDPAQLQLDVSRALGIASGSLTIASDSGEAVRLRPPAETGAGFVLHVRKNATSGAVERAVARHIELARQRPTDVTAIATGAGGKPVWNGALEAEFRGRPTEDGYHWRLDKGRLQYVREAPEEGQPARPKRVWDDKLGELVTVTGAPDAKAWPKDPPTSRETAFDDLGGNNAKTPFGRWVELMEQLGIKRDALVAELQEPSGLNYDTVRHNLKTKAPYQEAIKKWLTDPLEIRKRYPSEFEGIAPGDKAKQDAALRKAQHRAVIDIDKYLALKDATVWTEKWYAEVYAHVADQPNAKVTKVQTQVAFDKGRLNDQGIGVAGTRQADLMIVSETVQDQGQHGPVHERNVLKDVKSHEGPLTTKDEAQFADYLKLINEDVPRTDGTTTRIHEVVEVFLDPRGGKANAKWIAEQLGSANAGVSFEVFNTKGDRRTFGAQDFRKLKGAAALQAVIEAYCAS
jgi:hypothetical protein